MNQSSDIFVDFSAEIRLVLEYPDRDVVLRLEVDSLSGLDQQTSGNVSNSNYQEAMTILLTWGMRSFLIQLHTMRSTINILDGPKGYAQR
jgi:hypothetical protein